MLHLKHHLEEESVQRPVHPYYDKEDIYQFAKSKGDKTFCEQINKHFEEYGIDKYKENE